VNQICRARGENNYAMTSKKSALTPLQMEALRVAEEQRRRKEAIRAAQQFALRRPGLGKKEVPASAVVVNNAEGEAASSPPGFDDVRLALKSERHEVSKASGQNPRYVAAFDNEL
jgi:hypothetical protein